MGLLNLIILDLADIRMTIFQSSTHLYKISELEKKKSEKNQPELLHLGSQLSKKLTSLGRNLFGFIFVSNCFSK